MTPEDQIHYAWAVLSPEGQAALTAGRTWRIPVQVSAPSGLPPADPQEAPVADGPPVVTFTRLIEDGFPDPQLGPCRRVSIWGEVEGAQVCVSDARTNGELGAMTDLMTTPTVFLLALLIGSR